jgi:dTDP-4-amino-4,6-dideoxygalactose transaminase
MKTLDDYNNPFDAILEFEQIISEFTGAPYCVTTDCCTHALEIIFRISPPTSLISFPSRTYLSVIMLMYKLGIQFSLTDTHWRETYQFLGTNVWDSARQFKNNMYVPGTIQCISFGRTKPLQIGQGGCLLTDNYEIYKLASMMRSDGRDLFTHKRWADQQVFPLGFHYTMRPEECIKGINLLSNRTFTEQIESYYNYPDCSSLIIDIKSNEISLR